MPKSYLGGGSIINTNGRFTTADSAEDRWTVTKIEYDRPVVIEHEVELEPVKSVPLRRSVTRIEQNQLRNLFFTVVARLVDELAMPHFHHLPKVLIAEIEQHGPSRPLK